MLLFAIKHEYFHTYDKLIEINQERGDTFLCSITVDFNYSYWKRDKIAKQQ